MKLYMHPVSTACRPARLLIAESGITCDEETVDILRAPIVSSRKEFVRV
jgi:hypothetical protein